MTSRRKTGNHLHAVASATDGQGVILAVPHSVDARHRTAIDLLARRVSHRLGCPVVVGHVQRGRLHVDAAIAELHARGSRRVVVAPLTFAYQPIEVVPPHPRSAAGIAMNHITVTHADHLGGNRMAIAALLESLQESERLPHPATRLAIVIPTSDAGAASDLRAHLPTIREAGWRDGVIAVLPTNSRDCGLNGALDGAGDASVLLAPLAITPGPFTERVSACAETLGVDNARVSLHSADQLCALICQRVTEARRR